MLEDRKKQDELYKARYHALVSSHADLVSRYDAHTYELVYVSPSYCQFFGRTEADMLGVSIMDLLADDAQRRASRERLSFITPDAPSVRSHNTVRLAGGEPRDVDWVTTGIFDADETLIEFQSVGRDMTDLLRSQDDLMKSRMHYMQAAQIASVGFWVWDEIEDCLIFCTEEASAIYGITVEESLARSTTLQGNAESTHPDDLAEYENVMMEAFENKTGYDITIREFRKDGEIRYIRHIGEPVLNEQGELIQTVGTIQDVTDQKLTEEKIAHMARHDALTDLPNRALFLDRLETGLKAAKREKRQLAILFIDLDGFKDINDSDGHQMGDQLLIDVANRLNECVREMDTVSRIGGDEFAVILGGDITKDRVVPLAEKILTAISRPFELAKGARSIGASIGISLFPHDGETPDSLLAHADEAMYAVKRSGKNGYQFSKAVSPD